jgi:V8-like Glu-specific endopeptidase
MLFSTLDNFSYIKSNPKESDTPQVLISDIIGEDNRVRVTPTTYYPWSSIAKLYITWGGYTTWATGVMVDKNHVLTAAHCVYSHIRGGWADTVKVVPGTDNGYEPYGYAWSIKMRTYSDWINYADRRHDFAVLTLDRDIWFQTGWMELYSIIPDSSVYRDILNTAGYPGDLSYGNNMYFTSDMGQYADEFSHWYSLDAIGGQSGSPVWFYDGTNRYILSIHTTGYPGLEFNSGTRISQIKRECINNWFTADRTSVNKADLVSDFNIFAGFTPSLGGSGITKFDIWCRIRNIGTLSSNSFTISYYASTDSTFSEEDYLIGTDTVDSLAPTVATDSLWTGTIPVYIPTGNYYIGWIIDINNSIDEYREYNNWNYIWDYKLRIDAIPPTNPKGITFSSVWQGEVSDPFFNWSDSIDTQTGVAGYYYYWGADPNGTSSYFTTSSWLDPSSVRSGTYYLRVKAKDGIGNNGSWTTLYEFRYDDAAPINPMVCDQLVGLTENGVWQDLVNDPSFTWEESLDIHSGVAGYYYYWGSDPNGISTLFTSSPTFNPPPVDTGTYYLRISTKDNTGNIAPWTTLYEFKFKINESTEPDDIDPDDIRPMDSPSMLDEFLVYTITIIVGVFIGFLIFQGIKHYIK